MKRTALLALALVLGVSSTLAASSTVCPKYVVQAGDSLYSIQQKFGLLADALISSLQACGQSTDLLQVGQEICLPGAELAGCTNVQAFNNNANCMVYIVQQGDTLNSVASSLNLYNAALSSLNQDVLTAGILQPGKYLKLPPWSQSCGDPNNNGASCRVYIVNTGDFLAGIAAAFHVTSDELLAVNNGLTADTVLQNGQPIKIPPFPASCGAGTPTQPPTDTVLKCRGYRVQQGDSISSIAQMFKTTVNELSAVNTQLSNGALVQPGTVVDIPPYDSTCTTPILVTAPDSGSSPSTSSSPVPVTPVPVVLPSPVPVPISPSPVMASPPAVLLLTPPPLDMTPPPSPVALGPAAAPPPSPLVDIAAAPTFAPPPPPSAAAGPKAVLAAAVAVIVAAAAM